MQQQKNNKYFGELDCSDQFQENTAPVAKILHTKFLDALNSGKKNSYQTSIEHLTQFSDEHKSQDLLDYHFDQILSFGDFSFSSSSRTDSSENSNISSKKKENTVGPFNYTDSLLIFAQIDRNCDETQKSISLLSVTSNLVQNQERSQVISLYKMNKNVCLSFSNGSVFSGIVKNDKMERGVFRLQDVFEYEGQFQNDRFHGFGKLVFQSGFSIEGIWEKGRPVGDVTVRYPRGQVYEGQLVNFKKQGKGILFFNDGSIYQGHFQGGQITGEGCFYERGGDVFNGLWKRGQFIGNEDAIGHSSIGSIFQKSLFSQNHSIETK